MAQLLLFMVYFSVQVWGNSYTLADLEVLTAEEGHDEFFKHALDIRPSERQEAWKTMVSKMGDLYSRKVLQKVELNKTDFHKIEQLYN